MLSNMGEICKIFKKDSQLFATHSFTNSTSGSLFNNKPVICGGSNPNGKVSLVCSIFEDKSWRKFAQMSESRQYHTSIQIDENRLWVIGKNLHCKKNLEIFETKFNSRFI